VQLDSKGSDRDGGSRRPPIAEGWPLTAGDPEGPRGRRRLSKLRIAERENADLRARLSQQSLMLREVDHRAKNSLQLAASMLLLQSRRTRDNPAAPDLERAVERLQALAEIHRASYLAEDHDRIPVRQWLAGMTRSLVFKGDVAVAVSCPDVEWPFEIVGPVGLFVSEALANCVKHAFADHGGRVEVRLEHLDGAMWQLSVADDGAGLKDDASPGLGSQLLTAFARQLGGALARSAGLDNRGAAVCVRFPDPSRDS
jgi:two-component sensor histidine kinase